MNIQINNQQSAISNQQFAKGFSLMEVLLAVGILAVGMLFIAGVFPVGIYFTTVASERTIAATAADEAFAKIKLYGLLPATDVNWVAAGQTPFELVAAVRPPSYEFGYPSTTTDLSQRYWWSAICRRVDINDVQVTVFVSRKVGATTTYLNPLNPSDNLRPVAIDVNVSGAVGNYELTLNAIDKNLINDGYTIVDDASGNIYRVLERLAPPLDDRIRLDKPWPWNGASHVWVVPPPVGGGRYPCIAVYQKVMRF